MYGLLHSFLHLHGGGSRILVLSLKAPSSNEADGSEAERFESSETHTKYRRLTR